MRNLILAVVLASCALQASADELLFTSYQEVLSVWEKSKGREDFLQYQNAFVSWNNHFKLDTRNDCFQKGTGPVELLLVINSEATIHQVLSSVGGPKAECFRLSYLGIKTGLPPFSPLVLKFYFP